MTQIKYGPLWWKTRMGAQLQISCSAVLHFFRMNSKGLKPPPLGIEFPFHFKPSRLFRVEVSPQDIIGIQYKEKWSEEFTSL